ncbi:hypothetical protein [Pantanalinema sp. GBBB05]|uniref:hypothetical protein n=1 Tax=Pantanalinema sp. GBBB05 TaxID=2604139 RepID=UPI001DF2E86C|nr:hypothetical protein [Pantanalinema sp. GBBB05]
MIAPLNSEETSIVKADATGLSPANLTGTLAKEVSEPLPTSAADVTVMPDDVWAEGPLTYLGYYLEDTDEFVQRSSHSPRSLQQKMVRSGLIGAGILATIASGIATMDALHQKQPEAKTNQPLPPPETSQSLEQDALGTKAAPKPSTPEQIGVTPTSQLQFSLTPAPSITQLGQSTAASPVLPELSAPQLEATQASFSLPAPQLATTSAIAELEPETPSALALAQSSQLDNLEPESANTLLNAASADLSQPSIASPMDSAPDPTIANNISSPETFTTPLSSFEAASTSATPPLASDPTNSGQSFIPEPTQPTSTPIASNFPMATVQTEVDLTPSSTELALKSDTATITTPGDRLLEAVSGQPPQTVVANSQSNPLTATQPPVELPEDMSPSVRNLLQPDRETSGIQVAVMPLTQQESEEVALRERLGQFKVLHLGQQDYQQEWRTSNGGENGPAPMFGFVDYSRQVIAVMQAPTSTSTNPIPPADQETSDAVPTAASAIAQE